MILYRNLHVSDIHDNSNSQSSLASDLNKKQRQSKVVLLMFMFIFVVNLFDCVIFVCVVSFIGS